MLNFPFQSASLVSVLQKRAAQYPQLVACQFLADGNSVTAELTYAELDQRARAIAAFLQNKKLLGCSILLLYPAGLDFIAAFLGCLYAGVIAVPVPTPPVKDLQKNISGITAIAKDADIGVIFTCNEYIKEVRECFADLYKEKEFFVFDTSGVVLKNAVRYSKPSINDETICYLQYTSGSTGAPKAAVIQHKQLTHSLRATMQVWEYDKNSVTLNWAPHSHVYGLICGLLVPLYHGTPFILMPTNIFIEKPVKWLNAITQFQATHSGCPNFGYDLCVKEISDHEINQLNLQTWKVAVNGGDRVLSSTIKQFTEKFSRCGFQYQSFNPAFGMSEVTGAIAVASVGDEPAHFSLSSDALLHNEVVFDANSASKREMISAGRMLPGLEAIIVDPDERIKLPANKIGEIWLKGKSVVSSYWQRPEETEKTFRAKLLDSTENYFRTGDLGFLHEGQLCITGRLKEVIVVFGKKYYPFDLEKTVAEALHHYGLMTNHICFSVLNADKEEVIFLQEINENFSSHQQDDIIKIIFYALAKKYSIDLTGVILAKPGSIPKTASGKLQRKKCELLYQENKITAIKQVFKKNHNKANLLEQFQQDFREVIAKALGLNADQVTLNSSVSDYQINSIDIIKIAASFNEKYQFNLTPADLFSYQTFAEFFQDLLSQHQNIINEYYAGSLSAIENVTVTKAITETQSDNEIAIIGMSGIFPGADNLEEFWENLINGVDGITEIPAARWDWQPFYGDPLLENKSNSKWGGFINGISHFDASFFNISTREAELTDPQHRIFLQTVWRTIEDAGYSIADIHAQKTGLFVGVFNHDYAELLQDSGLVDAYSTTGVSASILANRVSYLLDLQGPSEAIDTACSSSLVAVHHAVQAIRNGDCECAIVGGVNALLTPTSYISASKAGMLSVEGRCKTFDKSANGFVRSEGVAAILIKPLDKALRDKNPIYAVIKGTAVNHGGRVNTMTAPNPNAQSDVVASAWRRAKIKVSDIQYIETHGTGTSLGDPVEFNGLKKAFQVLAAEQNLANLPDNYCALGAVKTHIGHLESAAGIAGIVKVLLSLKHEKIPANLNFSELNPYIEINKSPFYLANESQNWVRAERKRNAGISSFGFGGTNAHVVLEEAPLPVAQAVAADYPCLIALSAKTDAALQLKVSDLLAWLQQNPLTSLADIQFTLNKGRDHFNKRTVLLVSNLDNLKNLLEHSVNQSAAGEVFSIITSEKLSSLANQYLQGNDLALEELDYTGSNRISMPGYPFAKNHYWVNVEKSNQFRLHALLDENTSTLARESFVKTFSGNEFYIKDHLINNEKVLAGVVYLEMALQASKIAAGENKFINLKNIIWVSLLKFENSSQKVSIVLSPDSAGLKFAVNAADNLLVQGELSENIHSLNESIDLATIKAGCPDHLTKESFYNNFIKTGVEYGSSLKLVENIWFGNNQVCAELKLAAEQADDFILHPALLDNALQTVSVLLNQSKNTYVPYAIDEIQIYSKLTRECFVHAAALNQQKHTPAFDIKIVDQAGKLLIYIKNFALTVLNPETRMHYYAEEWLSKPPAAAENLTGNILVFAEKPEMVTYLRLQYPDLQSISVILGSSNQEFDQSNYQINSDPASYLYILNKLEEQQFIPARIIYYLEQGLESDPLQKSFFVVFNLCKALLQTKLNRNIQIMCVTQSSSIYIQALTAFAKSLYLENPYLQLRIVKIVDFHHLLTEFHSSELNVSYDENNVRWVESYREIAVQPADHLPLVKQSGVYLITGGMGNLGLIFAKYLAKNFQSKLVLINRSPLNDEKNAVITELELLGAEVMYLQADISKADEITNAVQKVLKKWSQLNGIIHTAGLSRDSFILKKSGSDCMDVFAPKITGTINLDKVTALIPLDFFIVFSSASAVLGNIGQCDYAYANHFMDLFTQQREKLQKQRKRFGLSLSINWPLWIDGGIAIAPESILWLKKTFGVTSMKAETGIAAFQDALASDHHQFIVLPGQKNKIEQALNTSLLPILNKPNITPAMNGELSEKFTVFLRQILAAATKLKPDAIKAHEPFEVYGIDSVMIVGLNQQLAGIFKDLPKTLFFEYQNLMELSAYFVKNYPHVLQENWQATNKAAAITPLRFTAVNPVTQKVATTDIAIIGVSGRYPEAEDLQRFWVNLKEGKDCITSLPADRWKTRPDEKIWGGFVADIDKFDPQFFNIAPREAEAMDPQERIFLETAWKTIEDAGYAREQLASQNVGVFVGVMYGQYQLWGAEAASNGNINTANSMYASIANRVSYYFDFHGPSIALDTMCSSSMIAIHLACQSIRNGESALAIAGGVNLHLHPNKFHILTAGKFLASDGRCRSFGEGGDGYVPGEGVGAVLLKPLSEALADKDHIYAVIKGSHINHGGKTNGYTVPNPAAQAAVIAEAYQKSQILPSSISYLETHGTGTALGDPIEIAALSKVFDLTQRQTAYAIGSVKSNIGHCESAAGIAAVTKVLLQFQHKQIVPSLHSTVLNSNINWETAAFKVQQELMDWDETHSPRRAGVSSFGAGGSNAHLILEEAPPYIPDQSMEKAAYLFTLSAKTETALLQKVKDLSNWLANQDSVSLADVSFTLNTGRTHFDKRFALVADSLDEFKNTLNEFDERDLPANVFINFNSNNKNRIGAISRKIFQQLVDEILNQKMDKTEYREHLLALANFFADGYEVPFSELHASDNNHRVALPAYPFSKERYWINKDTQVDASLLMVGKANPYENVQAFLIQQIASILKISTNRINPDMFFSDLGFDSITMKELANQIEEYYSITLLPTIFFTHKTIQAVCHYLLKTFSLDSRAIPAAAAIINHPVKKTSQHDAIAIIGMHGYLPQSKDLNEFWEHLIAGNDLVSEVPAERWDWRTNYGDSKIDAAKSNSKWGGFLSAINQFDAGFFALSAREANLMDPQHRLFLEVCWKAIEDAGINPLALAGQAVGVFAGVEFNEYQTLIANAHHDFHGYIATGNSHSLLTNRVSYFLNLTGPSETVDTACSSSLVAIHRAVNAIRNGECSMSIAGGVSLMVNPDTFVITSQLGALSPDGRCKTFDASANGYVKGEGVAALVLKSLADAEKDGDHIYAVIKGSAVNHGGKAQSITAPSATAQRDLLISAYANAGIDPSTISYIEAHGTGTELGDPIEVEALKNAFKTLAVTDNKTHYCGLGSLKTNIGHLEPASGIAGVIKVLLAMKYEQIPASIHFNKLNPYIDLSDSPFYLVNKTKPWDRLQDAKGVAIPRRAGISSFGFGGTNAHIVIEEALTPARVSANKSFYLLTLSAKQEWSLQKMLLELSLWLEKNNQVNLADLGYTLNTGRAPFAIRCAIVVKSVADLKMTLHAILNNQQLDNWIKGNTQQSATNETYVEAVTAFKEDRNLLLLADLFCQQYPIVWDDVYGNEKFNRIPLLPTYPFNHQTYWFNQETKLVSAKIITTDIDDYALNYLRNIFAEKLQIPVSDLEDTATYEVYGVDSVMGLDITQRLENDFGSLPKTLLYERNNLRDLAKYFRQKFNEKIQQMSGGKSTATDLLKTEEKILTKQPQSEDIAIIGLSGIYPLSLTMDELWENLQSGRDCVGEVPKERWNYQDYPVTVGGEEKYFNKGGFIDDVDKFDPLFFGIAPSDAVMMDPQERLFMQSAWATLEDAGYSRESLQQTVNNQVGVFVGVTYNFYPLFIAEEWAKGNRIPLDIQLFSIANRVSYFLNANGPSYIIDTACSSSLAAIHQAAESINRGECTVALAGGVNLSLHPAKYHMLGSLSFLSDEGQCASFGEGGTGYVPGEGVGSVLLKPLSLALRDNDRIYGVIKSSSMNHGGKTSGYTVPNPTAQAEVIKSALAKAKISADTLTYIEAHGTGTALGDPIEVSGLQMVFETDTDDKQFCALGSVKSNLGHLESAAGISQLTKVLLQLKNKKIVPSLHSKKLNPFVDFANSPFYVPQQLMDWESKPNMPRRAGVSSFGAGGVNVHIIIEEYNVEKTIPATTPFIFLLSAFNAERLQVYADQMYDYILNLETDDVWLANACYTSQIGREAMTARLAILADSKTDLLMKLKNHASQQVWVNEKAKVKFKPEDLTGLSLQKDNEKLILAWIDGSKINWDKLHTGVKPQKCYLPSYPFAKRRCWVGNQNTVTKKIAKKYMIFSDKELGIHCLNSLPEHAVCQCFMAENFHQYADNVFYINPEKLDDFTRLFASIDKTQELNIIYLWTLADDQDTAKINQRFIYLFQALVQQKWQQKIQFCLVNRENIADAEILQHHLWNLQEFIRTENNENKVYFLTLDNHLTLNAEAKLIQAELNNSSLENHINFSQGIRRAKLLINPERFVEETVKPNKSVTLSLDREQITDIVLTTLAQQLAMDVTEIDPEIAFLNYGLDSIIGINFVAELNKSFSDILSPMDLYRYPAVNELAGYVLKVSTPAPTQAPATPTPLSSEHDFLAEISHLNDAEVNKLLEAELLELEGIFHD